MDSGTSFWKTLLSLLQLGHDLVWQNRVTQHNNLLHFEGLTEVT